MEKDKEEKGDGGRFAVIVKAALDRLETTDWEAFGPVLEVEKKGALSIMWKTFQGGYEMHFFDMMHNATKLRGHAELGKVIFSGGKCERLDCLTVKFGESLVRQLMDRGHISKSPVIMSMAKKATHRRIVNASKARKKENETGNKSGKEVSE